MSREQGRRVPIDESSRIDRWIDQGPIKSQPRSILSQAVSIMELKISFFWIFFFARRTAIN